MEASVSRSFDEIEAALNALTPNDFDNAYANADGIDQLYTLTNELMVLPEPERAIPVMFRVIENLADSDLGSPGPLVHTLERMRGRYEDELVASIKRKPTCLSIWMVNRLLNVVQTSEQRQAYLTLLGLAAKHHAASEQARQDAQSFIDYQTDAA
jgi:hypothetical protein